MRRVMAITACVAVGASSSFARAQPAPAITVVGCLQRSGGSAVVAGPKSPSGFVLMNASTTPAGGSPSGGSPDVPATSAGGATSAGADTAATPQGTSGTAPDRRSSGIPDQEPSSKEKAGSASGQRPAGGAAVSPGMTYLLEGGSELAAHAGERVELRGTPVRTTGRALLDPDAAGRGAPNGAPQQLRVTHLRTLASTCQGY